MDDARYRIGVATARNLDPEAPERLEAALKEVAPDLYRHIMESAFGDILSRPGLDPKTREIATVSARGAVVGRRSAAAVGGCRRRRRQNTELILRCVV